MLNALERKYQETLGSIKELKEAEYEWVGRDGYDLAEQWYRQRLFALEGMLANIETTSRAFDPLWKRKALMVPIIPRTSRPLLDKNEFRTAFYAVVTKMTVPQTLDEIMAHIAQLTGLNLNRPHKQQRFRQMVYQRLQKCCEKGHMIRSGSPAKWFSTGAANHDIGAAA